MSPPVLNLRARWKRVVNFTPQTLHLRRKSLVPTDSWVGLRGCLDGFGEERILPPPLGPPATSLILETVQKKEVRVNNDNDRL
jgi:hypothetical protein